MPTPMTLPSLIRRRNLLLAIGCFGATALAGEPAPPVVPAVRSWTGTGGAITLDHFFQREPKTLKSAEEVIDLPWAIAPQADLEFPWILEMEGMKTAETGNRGVILSSDLVEICSDFSLTGTTKTKGPDGKDISIPSKSGAFF